jgi:hypothetical protein
MKREVKIPQNTRLYPCCTEQLALISRKLRLEKAEVVRRAVHEGLKTFQGAALPGTPDENFRFENQLADAIKTIEKRRTR